MIFDNSRNIVATIGCSMLAIAVLSAAPASAQQQNQGVPQQSTGGGQPQTLSDQPISEVAKLVSQARQLESEQQFQEAALVWQQISTELEKSFGKDSWQVSNAQLGKEIAIKQAGFGEPQMQAMKQIRDLQAAAIKETNVDQLLNIIQQAEALTGQLFGAESHMVAQIKTQAAEVLQNNNRPQEAWQQYRDALPIARKSFGPQHPDTELIYFKLGVLLHSAGQSDRAIDHLTQAVSISRNVHGESSAVYADRLTTLGVACQAVGRSDRALEYLMQGDKIQRKVLGEKHQRRAQTLRDIGITYLSMREPALAQQYLSTSIQILQETLQPNDQFMLTTMSQLATSLAMDGRNAEAETLLVKILEGNRATFGVDSPQTAKTEFQLGVMYGKRAAFKEADPLMQHAMQVQIEMLGPKNRATQQTAAAYIAVLERLGKKDQIAVVRKAMQPTSTAQAPQIRR